MYVHTVGESEKKKKKQKHPPHALQVSCEFKLSVVLLHIQMCFFLLFLCSWGGGKKARKSSVVP